MKELLAVAKGLKPDIWWIDAGWYPCNNDWPTTGNWYPNPDHFPNGMDPVGKKPGRGAYVCRQESCLSRAIKQKQLERQLEVRMTEEVAAALQYELAHLPAPEPEAD